MSRDTRGTYAVLLQLGCTHEQAVKLMTASQETRRPQDATVRTITVTVHPAAWTGSYASARWAVLTTRR